jgi:hypothetical protein
MKLNGWWRLWIACVLVWAILMAVGFGGFAYLLSSRAQENAAAIRNDCQFDWVNSHAGHLNDTASMEVEVKACLDRDAEMRRAYMVGIAKGWAAATLIPPLLALMLGFLAAWVARGFRQGQMPSS